MKWFILALRNTFDFKGRARRMEFWMFVLFSFLIGMITNGIDAVAGLKFSFTDMYDGTIYAEATKLGYLNTITTILLFIPQISVTVRRFHDVNKSGWWVLLPYVLLAAMFGLMFSGSFIFVGFMVLGLLVLGILFLVWSFTDGTPATNKYGPSPKHQNQDLENYGDIFVEN